MFVCPKCGPSYGVDSFLQTFAPQSRGKCEVCDEYAICADIHHSRLTPPEASAPRVGLMRFGR